MHRALFGVTEMSNLFEISKQTFNARLKQRYYRDFPSPAYTIASGRIWTFEQIDDYTRKYHNSHECKMVGRNLDKIGQVTMKMDGSV